MNLTKIQKKINNLRVLVIGDIILDKYFYSEVDRISPEAPVPIAKISNTEIRLGGAANVALNLSKLGAKTYLFGFLGKDIDGKELLNFSKKKNLNVKPFYPNNFHTITKTRIISRGNQLMRIDKENSKILLSKKDSISVKLKLKKLLNKVDLVVISDYQKGVLNPQILETIKISKKYISIDTKSTELNLRKLGFIKKNFSEAVLLSNSIGDKKEYSNTDEDVEKLGKFIFKNIKTPLLITRDKEGATFINKEIFHNKISPSTVYDVTGAGDTCHAAFTLFNYIKISIPVAISLMNRLAKITISNMGTYAPELKELLDQVHDKRILDKEQLKKKMFELKKDRRKIVFTNGCFDILHQGHISYLKKAKSLGDILIIGLNSDTSVKRIKGKSRPVIDEFTRAIILSHLEFVDYVVIFEENTPEKIIGTIKPNIHVKGGDYNKKELPETKLVESFGGKVIILPFEKGFSTSNIIRKIKDEKK